MISLDNQDFSKIGHFFQQQQNVSPTYIKQAISPIRNWNQSSQQQKEQEEKAKQLQEKEEELKKKAEEMQRLASELEEKEKKMKDWQEKLTIEEEKEKKKKVQLEQEKEKLKKESEIIQKQKEEVQKSGKKEKEQKSQSQQEVQEKVNLEKTQSQQEVIQVENDTESPSESKKNLEENGSNQKSEKKKKRGKKSKKKQEFSLIKASEWDKNKVKKSNEDQPKKILDQDDVGDFIVVRVDNQTKSKKKQKMHLAFQPKEESNLTQVKEVDRQDNIVYEKLQTQKQNEIKKSQQQKVGYFEPTEEDFPEITATAALAWNVPIPAYKDLTPGKGKKKINDSNKIKSPNVNSDIDFPTLGDAIPKKKR